MECRSGVPLPDSLSVSSPLEDLGLLVDSLRPGPRRLVVTLVDFYPGSFRVYSGSLTSGPESTPSTVSRTRLT